MLAGIVLFIIAFRIHTIIPPKRLIVVRFLQGLGAAALSAVSLAMVGNFYKEDKGKTLRQTRSIFQVKKKKGQTIF